MIQSKFTSRGRTSVRALTLIELLVVLSIIGLLLAILLPALVAGRDAAHDLKCRANLRSVVMEFAQFADPNSAGRRGDSERYGPTLFTLEDFQESIYQVDEFWSGPRRRREAIRRLDQPLMCPSVSTTLERRSGVPCDQGAIEPFQNVTIGFNMRLHTRTRYVHNLPRAANAYLSDQVLEYPDVPLLFDVSGSLADERRLLPYYSAPPISGLEREDIYSSGEFWFPAARHLGRINVAFVGGHVLSSRDPLNEAWWRWSYQPPSR